MTISNIESKMSVGNLDLQLEANTQEKIGELTFSQQTAN